MAAVVCHFLQGASVGVAVAGGRVGCSSSSGGDSTEDRLLAGPSGEHSRQPPLEGCLFCYTVKPCQMCSTWGLELGPVQGYLEAVGVTQSGFYAAFSLIFLSEVGDKTFFIAALLAMKVRITLTAFTSLGSCTCCLTRGST